MVVNELVFFFFIFFLSLAVVGLSDLALPWSPFERQLFDKRIDYSKGFHHREVTTVVFPPFSYPLSLSFLMTQLVAVLHTLSQSQMGRNDNEKNSNS